LGTSLINFEDTPFENFKNVILDELKNFHEEELLPNKNLY
jgi:hypothetical protein